MIHSDLRFDADAHKYYFDDVELPGVSRILTDMGLRKSGPWELDEKYRRRGHAVHLACHLVQEGTYDEATTHPAIVPYVQGYQQFVRDTGFTATLCEEPVCSLVLGTAGTFDQYGFVDGDPWLVDIKSGTLPPLVGVQLGAYRHMLREMRQITVSKCKAIRLEESGKYTIRDVSEQKYVNYWTNAVSIWKLRERHSLLG